LAKIQYFFKVLKTHFESQYFFKTAWEPSLQESKQKLSYKPDGNQTCWLGRPLD